MNPNGETTEFCATCGRVVGKTRRGLGTCRKCAESASKRAAWARLNAMTPEQWQDRRDKAIYEKFGEPKDFVDSVQACEMLGVSQTNLRQMTFKGRLQSVGKALRRSVYRREDVERVAKERELKGGLGPLPAQATPKTLVEVFDEERKKFEEPAWTQS